MRTDELPSILLALELRLIAASMAGLGAQGTTAVLYEAAWRLERLEKISPEPSSRPRPMGPQPVAS